jgi:ketol-acid reductoisomerase
MRRSKFSPTQIAKILKEFEQGKTADDLSREYKLSKATFYKWRERYAGMNIKFYIDDNLHNEVPNNGRSTTIPFQFPT